MTLRYLGQQRVTFASYMWDGHGATQDVDAIAASTLLLLRRKTGACCGAPKQDAGPLFEVSDNTGDVV